MQMDGTVIGVRVDDNARFHEERFGVDGISSGSVGKWTGLEENNCAEKTDHYA